MLDQRTWDATMKAFELLFTSDVGLMSLTVLTITLGMGGFYLRYFLKHMKDDAAAQARR
jgi:hypothetical protein